MPGSDSSRLHRAFSTLGCPDLSLEGVLRLAQKRGIDAVELRALDGTIELPALFQSLHGAPESLARHVAHLPPVRIAALDTSFHLVGSGPADREKLLAFVPWALALSARWLRVFDGGTSMDDASLADATRTLAWWHEVRQKEDCPLDLMIETHDSLGTADAILRLLAAAPEARILWDAHNMWRKSGEDPVETLRAIRPHVVHVHVKDSISRPSGKHDYSFVLPGQGEFPMAAVTGELRRSGFDGCVSLEWEKLWHPELAPLEEALASASARHWW
jgi:sugar phosphate isomerase/epimerase